MAALRKAGSPGSSIDKTAVEQFFPGWVTEASRRNDAGKGQQSVIVKIHRWHLVSLEVLEKRTSRQDLEVGRAIGQLSLAARRRDFATWD